jgi:phosphatidylglycerophosphatase A
LRKSPADGLAELFGSGFYSGYFPLFPGTVGSLVGLGVYGLLMRFGVLSRSFTIGWPVTLALVFIIGVFSARRCEAMFGHDSKRIVIDEIWGMLIALVLLPIRWPWIAGSFVLFRIFDIIKPFPGRRAERIGGGLGVMLDDGVAAVYALGVMHLIRIILG